MSQPKLQEDRFKSLKDYLLLFLKIKINLLPPKSCLESTTIVPLSSYVLNYYIVKGFDEFFKCSSNPCPFPVWLSFASWKKYDGGFGISYKILETN